MAWYNSLNDLRSGLGRVASNPITAGVVGATLGPWASAGIAGLGKAITPGANIGDIAKSTAVGGAAGYGGSRAGDALRSAGNGSIVGGLRKVAGNAGGAVTDAAGNAIRSATGGGGSGGGTNWAGLALSAAQAANAANLGKKSNDFANKGWDLAINDWDSRAPLRDAGREGLLKPQTRDLSSLTALRNANPVQKRITAGLPSGRV